MSTFSPPAAEQVELGADRIVLRDVPWEYYVHLRDNEANNHIRMSYYRGVLELMSPQFRHEKHGRRLDHLVMMVTAVLDIPCADAGSTTFRREDVAAGKEPDTCFYLSHEPRVREKEDLDLAIDPPPDLAIEVDNQNRSIGKLPIYAALGVPEVWRYDARAGVIWFGRLQDDGTYASIDRSEALPILTPQRVLDALSLGAGMPQSRWIELVREWVRGLTP
jgi:Uma2 family endonuclease